MDGQPLDEDEDDDDPAKDEENALVSFEVVLSPVLVKVSPTMNPTTKASPEVSILLEETSTPVSMESIMIGTSFPQTATHLQDVALEPVASSEGISK